MRRVTFWLAALAVVIASSGYSPSSYMAQTPVPMERVIDIAYGTHALQKLDLSIPRNATQPYPILLDVHGGGFRRGDKSGSVWRTNIGARFGAATIHVNYRLAPADTYPAAAQDVFCALAWIYSNAKTYQFDTSRIVAWGESAGGNLVALLGTVDNPAPFLTGCAHSLPPNYKLRGVDAHFAPVDLSSPDYYGEARQVLNDYMGGSPTELPAQHKEASPINYVNGQEPPFLLIHGTADPIVPVSESRGMATALKKVGVPVELVLIEGGGHGQFGAQTQTVRDADMRFFSAMFRVR